MDDILSRHKAAAAAAGAASVGGGGPNVNTANDDRDLTSFMDDLLSQSSSVTGLRAGTAPAQSTSTQQFAALPSMTMDTTKPHGRLFSDSLTNDGFASPSALHRLGGDGGQQQKHKQDETKDGAGGDGGGGDEDDAKKVDFRLRVGYYQMMGTGKPMVRYCFIPKAALRKQDFDFDEAFAALQVRPI